MCLCKEPAKTKVNEIISSDIKTIQSFKTAESASERMNKYKIKKLPVISENNIVGIITITDIAKVRPDHTKRFIESWIKPRWND